MVRKEDISVNDAASSVAVQFTPTIPHCSMATLIGLSIKVKLLRSLPRRFKVCDYDLLKLFFVFRGEFKFILSNVVLESFTICHHGKHPNT